MSEQNLKLTEVKAPNARERKFWSSFFIIAALYNLAWGAFVVLFPELPFRMTGMELPNYPSLFQAIGMMVLVFGYGYWLVSRDLVRYGHYVWLGLVGKIFGPIGFISSLVKGELPLSFGINILFNDIIWWIPFIIFLKRFCPNPFKI